MDFEKFSKIVGYLFLVVEGRCMACPPDSAWYFCEKHARYDSEARSAMESARDVSVLLVRNQNYAFGALLKEAGLSIDQVNDVLRCSHSKGGNFIRYDGCGGVNFGNNCIEVGQFLAQIKPLFDSMSPLQEVANGKQPG